MELIKPGTRIPFTKYRFIAIAISSVVNLLVLVFLFAKGPELGVDFAGGTVAQLKFSQAITIPQIRQALGELGAGDTVIQDFGQQGGNEFLVRLQRTSVQLGALGEQIKANLRNSSVPESLRCGALSRSDPKLAKSCVNGARGLSLRRRS